MAQTRLIGCTLLLLSAWYPTILQGQASTPVTLANTEFHQITTREGTTYNLYVGLPSGYQASSDATYPVLYVLDGVSNFPLMRGVRDALALGREVGPIILVGIDRAGAQSVAERLSMRAFELTPTRSSEQEARYQAQYGRETPTGGSPAFLRSLRDEVMPWVEERFKTDGNNGLSGFSLGGLFASYVLLTEPEVFEKYLIGSPSLWWPEGNVQDLRIGDVLMFDFEREYAASHDDLPAQVFLSAGTEEPIIAPPGAWMRSVLESRGYPSLRLEYHIFPDETHLSVMPATFSRGLRFLYGTP